MPFPLIVRPPQPYRLDLPYGVADPLPDLHARLADLGIQGVTRQGDKTFVTFPERVPLSVAKEIVRRVGREDPEDQAARRASRVAPSRPEMLPPPLPQVGSENWLRSDDGVAEVGRLVANGDPAPEGWVINMRNANIPVPDAWRPR